MASDFFNGLLPQFDDNKNENSNEEPNQKVSFFKRMFAPRNMKKIVTFSSLFIFLVAVSYLTVRGGHFKADGVFVSPAFKTDKSFVGNDFQSFKLDNTALVDNGSGLSIVLKKISESQAYTTSGTTDYLYDSGVTGAVWTGFSFIDKLNPSTVQLKYRASDDSSNSGAWRDYIANNNVNATGRYLQFQLLLQRDSYNRTPEISKLTINYTIPAGAGIFAATTIKVEDIGSTSAKLKGQVLTGKTPVNEVGFEIKMGAPNSQIESEQLFADTDSSLFNRSDGSFFVPVLGDLFPNTSFSFRALAKDTSGKIVYGSWLTFNTVDKGNLRVKTGSIAYKSETIAKPAGALVAVDQSPIEAIGFIYWKRDTTDLKEIVISRDDDKPFAVGNFQSVPEITKLDPGTDYQIMAFARDLDDTAYGDIVDFRAADSDSYVDIRTLDPSDITESSIVPHGSIITDQTQKYIESYYPEHGFQYGIDENSLDNFPSSGEPVIWPNKEITVVAGMTGLKPNTKYHIRAYLKGGDKYIFGDLVEFSTLGERPTGSELVVKTLKPDNIYATGAIALGEITSLSSTSIYERGFAYSYDGMGYDQIVTDYADRNGAYSKGRFSKLIYSLVPGKNYHIRAYARSDSSGEVYGDLVDFTTPEQTTPTPPAPPVPNDGVTVQTSAPTNITQTTVLPQGSFSVNVVSKGLPNKLVNKAEAAGIKITTRGFEYYSSSDTGFSRTYDSNPNGFDSGDYQKYPNISGLKPNTQYNIRSYLSDSNGKEYFGDNWVPFKTLSPKPATLIMTSDPSATATSAGFGATMTVGETPVTSRGFNYGKTGSSLDKTVSASGNFTSGQYGMSANDLLPDTNYQVRAFVADSTGIIVSGVKYFRTPPKTTPTPINPPATLPILRTYSPATNINANSFSPKAELVSIGNNCITIRGFQYTLDKNNSATFKNTYDQTNGCYPVSQYTKYPSIGNLLANKSYFYRAYVSYNNNQNVYGDWVTVTTAPATSPVVQTLTIGNISGTKIAATYVVPGGNIVSDGGAPITTRGFQYGLSKTSYKDTHDSGNFGTGFFTKLPNIGGLKKNTTYYIRAYATNSAGRTTFADWVNFKTAAK